VKNLIFEIYKLDHYCPLTSKQVINQRVVFIKKPICITPTTISSISTIAGSNPTIMMLANLVTFKIIVLVPSYVGNSTSSKAETLD
jgi:hypothetical protein